MRRACLLLVVLLLGSSPAWSCELCDGPGSSFVSLQNHVETWPLVAFAEPEATGEDGRTSFRITEILKGKDKLRVGTRVTPKGKRAILPNRIWVLLGVQPDFSLGTVLMLRPATRPFLRAVPTLPPASEAAKRLRALVPWLQDKDPMVSASARQAFAQAPYPAVRAASRHVDVDALLAVLANPRKASDSRGTLFLLLGLRAGPAERKRLATWMADPEAQAARGYAALLAAWLMSTGEPGIAAIERVLRSAGEQETKIGPAFALALGFHVRNENDVRRSRALSELDALLDRPTARAAAIEQLGKLEAWDRLSRVLTTYARADSRTEPLRTAVLGYLEVHPGAEAARAKAQIRAQGDG